MSRPKVPWRYVGWVIIVAMFAVSQWIASERAKVSAAVAQRDINELKAMLSVQK